MAWAPLLLTLLTYCLMALHNGDLWFCVVSGSSYQLTLTQPPAMSVTPGETVQLACVLSREVSISDSYIRWYQQKQGEKPRYLLYYKDDSTQGKGSGVPDRFTASKDTSRHTCFLTISRAQAEDDADYYCADWDGPANQYTVIQDHTFQTSETTLPKSFSVEIRSLQSAGPLSCDGSNNRKRVWGLVYTMSLGLLKSISVLIPNEGSSAEIDIAISN
uniref:Ig-like domain-containing protein n=1 Tax=Gopherus agassizii TaxID=38772 RepID=A0A452HIW5_9SAUR